MAEELPDGFGAGNPGEEGSRKSGQPPTARTLKGKSCKGCLYYSSLLKSDSRNPVCVGISRTLPTAPLFIMGESEMKATQDGHDLSDFKYACIGYSIFMDNNDNSTDKQEHRAQLPFCAGIELLVEKRVSITDHVAAPVPKEDATARSPSRPHQPGQSSAELLSRFRRNAGVVASGVAKNLNKVGNHIKDNIDDIFYPYRKPPK
ncbi:hypothetical protein MUK42_03485 [Musa troglodytarum]|uniref:DUF8204 domain-containing protein n=1 Tax=Musa troglodytarum TaxID=320322 RepID=A0A9E7L5C3_9LILI|nr:hypothetical protein MUK42_03485 [Musa troglodytarum]URE46538.1 hypothetical protein MUK42_03485 [Musa troglodytarum]